ncbi:hypothetical protein PR048_024813 [Dryococelus australis]|uniref:Integrase catalytic domain-containing protein n=1 Tax=Dryococelus australis TaxID=614101 RepID=A0ABQ9GPP3_9NEOP|nr:hypothetical protein PR048_024813 [Dryococelus australis]
MKTHVEVYVRQCKSCPTNKLLRPKTKAPTAASKLFEKTALDIVGPLIVTDENNRCILLFQDELTKFITAIPLPNQEAETVAKDFVTEIILRYGTPQPLLSGQGTDFMSELFKNVRKMLKIKKIQTTALHPQENLKALPRVGNTVNIKIHTSSENVSLSNEDVPLRDISDETSFHSEDQATHSNVRRSARLGDLIRKGERAKGKSHGFQIRDRDGEAASATVSTTPLMQGLGSAWRDWWCSTSLDPLMAAGTFYNLLRHHV